MNINGFEIETYNQHRLQENAKYSTCPLCSHTRQHNPKQKCLTVFWDTGLAYCSHCGERIQLHTFKKRKEEKKYIRPKWENNTNLSEKIVKWFETRKISQFTIRLMKICGGKSYMPQTEKEENTIQFPYFLDTELINIKYRDGSKNFKLVKGAEKTPYNMDGMKLNNSVIIVEGEMDCLSFIECSFHNCISIPNGANERNVNTDYFDNVIEYFDNKEKIYLALDNDGPGKNTQNEIGRRLGIHKCLIVDFEDCKDANEYLCKHGKEKLKATIENAKPFPVDGIIYLKDIESQIYDEINNGCEVGTTTYFPSLDPHLKWLPGTNYLFSGYPNHGKSEFTIELALIKSKYDGDKWAVFSSESYPPKRFYKNLIEKYTGKSLNNRFDNFVSDNELKSAMEFINDHIFFVYPEKDVHSSQELIKRYIYLINKHGITGIISDPFNQIIRDMAKPQRSDLYLADYIAEKKQIVHKYQLLNIEVVHPKNPDIRQFISGEPPQPNVFTINEGAMWNNALDVVVIIHRPSYIQNKSDNSVIISVDKVRDQKLRGLPGFVKLEYNRKISRYLDKLVSPFDKSQIVIKDNENDYWWNEEKELNEYTDPIPF